MNVRRGGGDRTRSDVFRLSARSAALAAMVLFLPGAAAATLAAYDMGGILDQPGAAWLMPGSTFLMLSALVLGGIAWRKPVLLTVGPRGLGLPATLARPVPWESIRRVRCVQGPSRAPFRPRMLKIDLLDGARLEYMSRFWTLPGIDSRIARRHGLNAPLQYLDADEETVIASIERFSPVDGVTS
jgi:hypothetical protein